MDTAFLLLFHCVLHSAVFMEGGRPNGSAAGKGVLFYLTGCDHSVFLIL